jgi:hypothetical protein
MPAMLARAAAVWFGIMLIAVANGALRIFVIVPLTGEGVGHIVSTLFLCLFVLFTAAATIRWIGAAGTAPLCAVGGLWLAMTLAFEFLAGHFLFGNSWDRLLANYDVAGGRIWVLVLVTTFFAPLLGRKLRGEIGGQ